jgi:hypothetical protein
MLWTAAAPGDVIAVVGQRAPAELERRDGRVGKGSSIAECCAATRRCRMLVAKRGRKTPSLIVTVASRRDGWRRWAGCQRGSRRARRPEGRDGCCR